MRVLKGSLAFIQDFNFKNWRIRFLMSQTGYRRNEHPIFELDWRSSHTGHLPKNNCVDHYRSEQIT